MPLSYRGSQTPMELQGNSPKPAASNALQRQDLDLAAAYTVANGVINRMNTMRTEEQFKEIYHNATIQAETRGINMPEEIPGQARRQKSTNKV